MEAQTITTTTIGKLREGNVFKESETDAYYYVRGKYNTALKRFSCQAYRCKDHARYSWADRAFDKAKKVTKYSPENDTRNYHI